MIKQVKKNKKRFLNLLLLADEQENMIDKYIDGDMFIYQDKIVKACCIVKEYSKNTIEIKNIAVLPCYQKKGIGKQLIDFITKKYSKKYYYVIVGTGDSLLTIPFYEKCGFIKYKVIPNFFIDNYNHKIIENGKQLIDMVYLKKKMK